MFFQKIDCLYVLLFFDTSSTCRHVLKDHFIAQILFIQVFALLHINKVLSQRMCHREKNQRFSNVLLTCWLDGDKLLFNFFFFITWKFYHKSYVSFKALGMVNATWKIKMNYLWDIWKNFFVCFFLQGVTKKLWTKLQSSNFKVFLIHTVSLSKRRMQLLLRTR